MSVTFGLPAAALGALAGLVPVAVALARTRTDRRLRRELGLGGPPLAGQLARPAAFACAFGLLGLAAAQPSVRTEHTRVARADAQMVVILDSSRSMLASSGPTGFARYRRAAAFAYRLRSELPEVPAGLSSLTNRVLPYLFPTADASAYDLVLAKAYGIERPPPALTAGSKWVTTFDPLSEVARRHFFSASARRKVLVVLTDAETRDFDARGVMEQLLQTGITPIIVRFWHRGERIYNGGRPVGSYRATDPPSLVALRDAGWPMYRETELAAVVRRVEVAIGSGPVSRVGYDRRETSIAPMIAFAALAPLLLLLAPAGRLPALRRRSSRSPVSAPARSTPAS